jgi:acyl-CoA synthetase (AMP-forming)/AMP-acid ligase II
MSDTFAGIVRARAKDTPDALAYRHLVDGDVQGTVRTWTYGELDREAAAVARVLSEDPALKADASGPPRVLLLFDQELAFLAGFFGCL